MSYSAKLFLLIALFALVGFAFSARAADSATDPVSGLPLFPGMTPENSPMKIVVCKKQAQINLYHPDDQSVAKDLAWYTARLPGYRKHHFDWDRRSQDTLYSPDGTKAVNIVGSPSPYNDNVFGVSYMTFQPGLTEHEMAVFSPSNTSCK
jgi:hypothetical protein